jgi:hypothetical protein
MIRAQRRKKAMDTQFTTKLKTALKELEKEHDLKQLKVVVQPSGGGRFVASVFSSSFAEIPDEYRQDLVWQKIIDKLNDYEQRLVEFVYTDSPSDQQEAGESPDNRKKQAKAR